jgi:hypothetical protein
MTSKNICVTHEFDNAIFYKAHCSCSLEEHEQTLVLEKIEEDIYLQLYHKVFCTAFWCPISIPEQFKDYFIRIKLAFNMLIKGYVEYEGEFIFEDKQSIQDYINALQEGLNKLSEHE